MQKPVKNIAKSILKDLTLDEQAEILTIKIMEAYDNWHFNVNTQFRMNLRDIIKTILKQNL
jgi:hypothetical protein